jgi:glycosyltransferase involved in cell wall biosynthesis
VAFKTVTKSIIQHSMHKFRLPDTSGYDIWHATYQNTAYLPQRNKNIKVLLTIHDLNFMYDQEKNYEKKAKHLKHLQTNIDRSDAIVCISDFCKNDVVQYCKTGNKPIHVIYNGTNILREPKLTPLSYKPSKEFLFSIGVLTRKKNFHALLPLVKNNDIELLIAGKFGDQSYVDYLMDSANEMGIKEKVHVLGRVSENEKAWYFNNCYAFASASLAEGFCLPVTEAMSVGKPLFLSNQTALPEIGGKAAFYFSDFDSKHMQSVFSAGMNDYRELNMYQYIKDRGERFCWQKAAQEYLAIYRSL